MNKRNSILESLSEGMLQTAKVKRTKNAELFTEYALKTRGSNSNSFLGFFRECMTNTASKYTDIKSTYGGMYIRDVSLGSID